MDEFSDGRAIYGTMRPAQTRWSSLAEALVNTLIGFGVAMISNAVILPMYGIHPSLELNFIFTCWFTVISVVRSYFVRRMWETGWWKRIFQK